MGNWDTVITSKTRLLDIPLAELWQYRGMVWMLVKKKFQLQSRQTVLGHLWTIGSVVFSTGLFSFVFGYIGKFQSDGMPYYLFYMLGSNLWWTFSNAQAESSSVFSQNAYLFGKVYFPRLAVPASNLIATLAYFLIRFCVCMAVWLFCFLRGEAGFGGWCILLVPLAVFASALLGTGIGLIVSSLTIKYRDFHNVEGFAMQLLMYTAPVVFPVAQLPESIRDYAYLNPMTSFVELFRIGITGCGCVNWWALLYSVVFTAAICFGSLVFFNQVEKSFVDIV